VHAPAARDPGHQHLGLEHEAAPAYPDVVEELDRIDAEPGPACQYSLSPQAQFMKKPATRIALSRSGGSAPASSSRPPITIVRRRPRRVEHERDRTAGAASPSSVTTAAAPRSRAAAARRSAAPLPRRRVPDHLGPGAPGHLAASVARPVVDDQYRTILAGGFHDTTDRLRLVEDRNDDQDRHAARARGPATTIAI
jgi:hypothetical protein